MLALFSASTQLFLLQVNSQPSMGSLGTLERKDSNRDGTGAPSDCYLSELHRQLSQVGHAINWLVV